MATTPWKRLTVLIALTLVVGVVMTVASREESRPADDPTIAAAGDIACDPNTWSFNAGLGTTTACRQRYTSDLIETLAPDAVLPLGDNQYEQGAYDDYLRSYDPTWGRAKAISHPTAGNHEYLTAGATGYFSYFGSAAGDPTKGYYSYNVGAWHLVALNSNCGAIGGCGAESPEEQWLRADLAEHATACTLAYWHHPRFSSGRHGSDAEMADIWRALFDAGADVVLSGHDHDYERFAPQGPDGAADTGRGIREFVVGTGGKSHYTRATNAPNSEVFDDSTFGVLELTLHATTYDWRFLPEQGGAFTDAGSAECHYKPEDTAPPSVSGTASVGSELMASTGSWIANPTATYGFQWRRCDATGQNCSPIAGATVPTYALRPEDVDSTISVSVTASNALGATTQSSPPTAAVTGPPYNVTRPTLAGIPGDGQLLSASAGTWSGTPPVTFEYLWRRCDPTGLVCASILGAAGPTYVLSPADVGWRIRVRVVASNDFGTASRSSLGTEVVSEPPHETASPRTYGEAVDGKTLTADPGAWTGTEPIAFSYQWERCSAAGTCGSIDGATAPTYTLSPSDIGFSIRIDVVASNGGGAAEASSDPTAPVAAAPPTNVARPTISGAARLGESLTTDGGAWTGTPPISLSYGWHRCDSTGANCTGINGATAATYTLTGDDVGWTIRVWVAASNVAGEVLRSSAATPVVAGS